MTLTEYLFSLGAFREKIPLSTFSALCDFDHWSMGNQRNGRSGRALSLSRKKGKQVNSQLIIFLSCSEYRNADSQNSQADKNFPLQLTDLPETSTEIQIWPHGVSDENRRNFAGIIPETNSRFENKRPANAAHTRVGSMLRLPRQETIVLRLFTGVVLGLVAVCILTGVDVLVTETFSGSESESWTFMWTVCFLFKGAISLSISFWFYASIFAKSDMISFLRDVFISIILSGSVLGTLLELATRFSDGEFSVTEVSKSPETISATAFLFWLLVVIFAVRKVDSPAKGEFFEKDFCSTLKQRNSLSLLQLTKLTN